MKLLLSLFALSFTFTSSARACTIFASPFMADMQVGHNVDWPNAAPNTRGIFVLNPAHLNKKGMIYDESATTAEWTSKWSSLTFSIAGAEFPVAGMNEHGLFMGILMLSAAQYPPANDPRLPLSPTQLVQYSLDMGKSLDDVAAFTQKVRPFSSLIKMHYFACDASGECAVIQYVDGQAQIFRGRKLPYDVLTNSLYSDSVDATEQCRKNKCDNSNLSLWRFAQAALGSESFSEDADFGSQAFELLDKVIQKQVISTRFQLLYDYENASMQIRVPGQAVATVHADLAKVACGKNRLVIPYEAGSKGDLSGKWENLTEKMQHDLAIDMGLPEKLAAMSAHYPFTTSCQ